MSLGCWSACLAGSIEHGDASTREWRKEDLKVKVIVQFKATLGSIKAWVGALREKTTECGHRLK